MSAGAVIIIINPPRANAAGGDVGSTDCLSMHKALPYPLKITVEGMTADPSADDVVNALYAAISQIAARRSLLAFHALPPGD